MSRSLFLAAALVAACGAQPQVAAPLPTPTPTPAAAAAPTPTPAAQADRLQPPVEGAVPPGPPAPTPIADAYRADAAKILAARGERSAFAKLTFLCDRIGHRLAGTPSYERAAAWAEATMKADGLVARREPVQVTPWIRGAASAAIVAPVSTPLHILALGLSPGTPQKGLTGEVVIVDSIEALEALGARAVKGKIVLFNHRMPAYTEEHGSGYDKGSNMRMRGPSAAARLGAAAALVRSATAVSLRTPHTGATLWADGVKPIPAAAVTLEDAELLVRLAAEGPVTVRLVLGCKTAKPITQSNVVGELVGREKPEEIVLIGAHLDSWDVGQGAHDDGGGVVVVMEAAALLKRLGLVPRRTIRVVLFANEEHGLDGAFAYAKDHAGELGHHVAAMESDGGVFQPRGFSYQGKPEDPAFARLGDLITLLEPLGAARAVIGYAGTDLYPLADAGMPRLGHDVDGSTYFDIHHTEADTLDKVDPAELQDNVLVVAIVAYVLAELPVRLDAPL